MLLEIFDPTARPRPIGIDLGTTHSLVAAVRNERPEVLLDCNQEALVPSIVAYDGEEIIVGTPAKARAAIHPTTTIVSVKRFMGRGGDDPETRRMGPYEFVTPKDGEANVVRFRVGRDETVTPVEVSSEILLELKRRAEDEIGTVGGVVITVPAYFDDAQRQATKDAGRLAGLDVLRLLNEPTAAALAYGLDKKKNGTFAVYDLGGGTFDVTILLLDDGVFQVKSTGGDSALGGDDMDQAIAHFFATTLGWEETKMPPAFKRLLLDTARTAKHALTDAETFTVDLPTAAGETRAVAITRAHFEELIVGLLERTGKAAKRALRDAELAAKDLDGVILVGGSTRVPAVRAYVKKIFEQEPLVDLDPDQVVALGAAIQAEMLAGDQLEEQALLLDVIPLSLGIEVGGGVVDKILPRNTTIPTAARASYTTQEDKQTGFEIHVVQGERELAADCRSLARFTLRGIPPMAAGMAKLEVTLRVNADGLLDVEAKELTTGIEQTVSVKPTYGLDDEAVEKMLMDAIDFGEDDLLRRRLAEARVEGQRILRGTEKALAADAALLEEGERAGIDIAMANLRAAIEGTEPSRVTAAIESLDKATNPFAGRRMNRAIAQAVEGRKLDEIEKGV